MINYEQKLLQNSDESIKVSELAIFAQKWCKITLRKKEKNYVFSNHPDVHSGELARGLATHES